MMAFQVNVQLERWTIVLKLVDDMMRIVVIQAIGEGTFNYNYTWKTKTNIIGMFINCLARARVDQ